MKLYKWKGKLAQVIELARLGAMKDRSDMNSVTFLHLNEEGATFLLDTHYEGEFERLIPWERLWEQASE